MPVVLHEAGGVARSGHEYEDRTGVSYEYPSGRYEKWIVPGERFIYQAPRIGYFGCGVIGEIFPSVTVGRLVCTILDARMFVDPVPLKDPAGNYYEADPTYWQRAPFWSQGVRPLSEVRYADILHASGTSVDLSDDAVRATYASPADAAEVERYSVDVALEWCEETYKAPVTEMHHNNPGFDILVGDSRDPKRFVEVKGTRSSSQTFFLTEAERLFALRNNKFYTLALVSGIDLQTQSHIDFTSRDGALDGSDHMLEPQQWRGRLSIPRA